MTEREIQLKYHGHADEINPDWHRFAYAKSSKAFSVREKLARLGFVCLGEKENLIAGSSSSPPGRPYRDAGTHMRRVELHIKRLYNTRTGDIRKVWKLSLEFPRAQVVPDLYLGPGSGDWYMDVDALLAGSYDSGFGDGTL